MAVAGKLKSFWTWLTRRPGLLYGMAADERVGDHPPERFRHAWLGVMGWSLV